MTRSTSDEDELQTAAVWLYKLTGNGKYLEDAENFYNKSVAWAFDWDNKGPAANVSCVASLWILTFC